MKLVENIKFSNGMHYRSVIFIEKITDFKENDQDFQANAYHSVIFIEKLQFS